MAVDIRALKEEANTLAKAGKFADAIKPLKILARADKKDVQHALKIAELYGKLGKTGESIEWYETAAQSYAEQGHLPKAIAIAKIILKIDPKHEQTQTMLSELYAKKDGPPAGLAAKLIMPPKPAPVAPVVVPAAAKPAPEAAKPDPFDMLPDVPARPFEEDIDLSELDAASNSDGGAEQTGALMGIDEEKILAQLPHVPLFSDLKPDEFESLIQIIEVRAYEPNEYVISEGEPGDSFYVITSGSASVRKEDYAGLSVTLATLQSGAFFGEFAYLAGIDRTASVVAEENLEVLEISRGLLDKFVAKHPRVRSVLQQFYRDRVLNTLLSISPLFEPFDEAEKQAIILKFHFADAQKEEVLLAEGIHGDGLYVVVSGEVSVTRQTDEGPEHLADLHAGEFFGEMSLLTNNLTSATVKAANKVSYFKLPREEFEGVSEAHPELRNVMKAFAAERRMHNETMMKNAMARGERGLV